MLDVLKVKTPIKVGQTAKKVIDIEGSNWDHSAHCVKVSNQLRLFPESRSERKFWWANGIRRN